MAVTGTETTTESEAAVGVEADAAVEAEVAAPTLLERLWRWRVPMLIGAVFLIALVVAWRNRPGVLYDDAAITMRYAWRIGHGYGWTYNDLDRTNGASAPLYTMILAVLGVGLDLPPAARAFGVLCYATAVALATFLAQRIAGMVAAVFAALFLLTWIDFQFQSLSGMESALSAVIGLAVIIALLEDRDGWAGVLLGLALINKLDAGMLLVAVAGCYLLLLRRPPWRVLGACVIVFTPWMLLATAYFGSVLPYSFTQKASSQVDNPTVELSRTWILEAVQSQRMIPMVLLAIAAIAAVVWLARTTPRSALALAVCVAWPVLHGFAFSVVPLGDRYPWYLTVLYPPLAIAAACAIAVAVRSVPGWWRVGAAAAVIVPLALVLGFRDQSGGRVAAVARSVVDGPQTEDYEAFEVTRREAAKFLATQVQPGDVISTCFGWVAYESRRNPISESCPLNTRKPVGVPRWATYLSVPSTVAPVLPPNATIVGTFVSDTDPATQVSGRFDVVRFDLEAE